MAPDAVPSRRGVQIAADKGTMSVVGYNSRGESFEKAIKKSGHGGMWLDSGRSATVSRW
jgi:hypothetical protein